ncbi:MAG TPA: DUF1361 domain-containing protein [Thermoanaerobaculia bacterium]
MTKRVLPFAALLIWCSALLMLRMERSDSVSFAFLYWNLFLAAVPFGAALVLEALDKLRRLAPLQWGCFIVWLLFLPNAPYIVTDFIHLRQRTGIPLWYDILLLISSAGTGLILGYASVMIVQRIVARRYGVVRGWFVAVTALILSAFGIYLGRFLRFNSWEVLSDPMPLFSGIASRIMNPFDYPRTFAVTALFGVALTLGYVALHAVAEMVRDDG